MNLHTQTFHTVVLLIIIRLHGLESHSSLAKLEGDVTYTEIHDFAKK